MKETPNDSCIDWFYVSWRIGVWFEVWVYLCFVGWMRKKYIPSSCFHCMKTGGVLTKIGQKLEVEWVLLSKVSLLAHFARFKSHNLSVQWIRRDGMNEFAWNWKRDFTPRNIIFSGVRMNENFFVKLIQTSSGSMSEILRISLPWEKRL